MTIMSATLLGNINIEDMPSQEARPFKAVGLVGETSTREIANGYTQVHVPITYRLTNSDQQDRTFNARFNIKTEWLTPEFKARVQAGNVTDTERIQYQINVAGLLKGLFTSAGIKQGTMDLSQLTGRLVGFKTKPQRQDPSRLDVSYFFAPKA